MWDICIRSARSSSDHSYRLEDLDTLLLVSDKFKEEDLAKASLMDSARAIAKVLAKAVARVCSGSPLAKASLEKA